MPGMKYCLGASAGVALFNLRVWHVCFFFRQGRVYLKGEVHSAVWGVWEGEGGLMARGGRRCWRFEGEARWGITFAVLMVFWKGRWDLR